MAKGHKGPVTKDTGKEARDFQIIQSGNGSGHLTRARQKKTRADILWSLSHHILAGDKESSPG